MSFVELDRKPTVADLRWFGTVVAAFFGILAAVAWLRFDRPFAAGMLGAAGAGLAAVYYLVRPLRIPMFHGWTRLFFPLGWAVSHLALAVLYFLIVTPIALVLRVVRKDPLARTFDRDAATYWVEHRTGRDPARYLRQY
ncbi:MAG: SxtJ family membrane protein [bacterium]